MAKLLTLGGLSVVAGGAPMDTRRVRKPLAILAVIAASSEAGMSRDRLEAFFWPESDAERARGALKQALYLLRQTFGGDPTAARGTSLVLDQQVLTSDIVDFRQRFAEGDLAGAVALYSGPFLDGVFLRDTPDFEQWVESERARLAASYAQALERLAEEARARDDAAGAVEWWRRRVELDRLSARAARAYMEALAANGEHEQAVRFGNVHVALVKQELGTDADATVLRYLDELRRSELPAPPTSPRAAGTTQPAPVSDAPTRPRWWWVISLAAAAVVLLLPMLRGVSPRTATASVAGNGVAVLPFVNIGADTAAEYFSDGMTEELIGALTKIPGIRVSPRSSSFTFKGRRSIDLNDLSRQLGVAMVVEGSVRRAGGFLRVSAQLVDVRRNANLWSDTYDRPAADVFAVQDELAKAIVGALGTKLGTSAARPYRRGTDNLRAYDLYLQGRYRVNLRTKEDMLRGIDAYEKAIALDSTFAEPIAGIANTWTWLADFYFAPREAYPKAETAARRAIAIDSTLASAHAGLAAVLAYYTWDFPGALREARTALSLDSTDVDGHVALAFTQAALGMRDSAAAHADRIAALDPLSAAAHAVAGYVFRIVGRMDRYVSEGQRMVELQGVTPERTLWIAERMWWSGRRREADSVARAACASIQQACTTDKSALIALGDTAALRRLNQAREAQARDGYVNFAQIAAHYLAIPDTLNALRCLERAVEQRDAYLTTLAISPEWEPLRRSARFKRVLQQVGLQNVTPR
jgi:adenylate cyclase